VDLNAHEAGNGGQKPREAYSSPSLLYSEDAALASHLSNIFIYFSQLRGLGFRRTVTKPILQDHLDIAC